MYIYSPIAFPARRHGSVFAGLREVIMRFSRSLKPNHVFRKLYNRGDSAVNRYLVLYCQPAVRELVQTKAAALLGRPVAVQVINLQLAKRKRTGKSVLHWVCIALCIVLVAGFLALLAMGSPYLSWNYQDPETAVAGVALHAAEWLYVRAAPVLLLAAAVGTLLTRKRE